MVLYNTLRVSYGAKHFPTPPHHSGGLLQQLAHHTRRAIAHHRCLQTPWSNQHHFADMSQHGTVDLWIRAYHHCRRLPTSTTSTCWNLASPHCSPAGVDRASKSQQAACCQGQMCSRLRLLHIWLISNSQQAACCPWPFISRLPNTQNSKICLTS